jgi:nicotinamide mononucleotide transporter
VITLHETAAAVLSASAVWLTTRRSPWCFPVGLLSVSVYIWVYAGARLYSEVLLQCFWVVMLLAGWWRWLRHLDATGHVRVAPLQRRAAGLHLLAGVAGGLALGFAMHRYTNAALPWLDAMLTALSLVGQFWQNRRHVAAWWMWIAVDVVYVGMFASKHLFVTAVLYVGFVALAAKGLRDWTRAAATTAATPAAD